MKLRTDQLNRRITSDQLPSRSLPQPIPIQHVLGQARASEALEFGIAIDRQGYNLYMAGNPGTGRRHYITEYLKPIAAHGKTPPDWLYVSNFETPSEPRCIALPHGQGLRFQHAIEQLIQELLASFPDVFENPAYIQQRTTLHNTFNQRYDDALALVEKAANKKGIALYRENGVITFGVLVDGQIGDDAYHASLSEAEREAFLLKVRALEELLNQSLIELPKWQREVNNQLRQLLQKTIKQVLKPLFDDLLKQYAGHAGIQLYLGQMQQHLLRIIEEQFSGSTEESRESTAQQRKRLESYYRPNLLSKAGEKQGLPVVLENNPSYSNLFGQVNPPSPQSDSATHYQHIIAGAIHYANGGYLILDIEKVLADGRSWQALKRILREASHSIDMPSSETGQSVCNIKPQAIPIQLKVILIGSREIYYALNEADSEFSELFRVLVDFDNHFALTPESLQQFSCLVSSRAKALKLASLSADAMARLAEYACRLAEHQEKLTTHINLLMDILTEANFWREKAFVELIDSDHIEQAISRRKQRHARTRDSIINDILAGFINITTSGKLSGQVNGLAVLRSGDTGFGCPLRITATAHPGSKGIVDIEREVKLGQAAHSKGILILSGYLCGRYAQKFALSISANIAVEQSYGFIDGDSASLAELCALKSAIIEQALSQDIAITGSISQFGEVQAIGGVNEKIEGFFDICAARGLTGTQGVIIPVSNQPNLMLAQRVIDAVEQGLFSVYAVKHVDEAMEVLSGEPAGMLDANGDFTKDSLNDRITRSLQQFSQETVKQ